MYRMVDGLVSSMVRDSMLDTRRDNDYMVRDNMRSGETGETDDRVCLHRRESNGKDV